MFVKRTAQIKLLEDQYAMTSGNLVILYGRKGVGTTTLLNRFLQNKQSSYYYEGTECDPRLQLRLMNLPASNGVSEDGSVQYPHLFSELTAVSEEKPVIVLDEFHYIIRNHPDFLDALMQFDDPAHPFMIILCSSSIRWVENDMIRELGSLANRITAFLKLKEFTFVDFVSRFPKSSVETCIHINAVLGGIPDYLEEWQEERDVHSNIKNIFLDKNSRLFMATQHFLKLELREPAVYNTILYALANGNRKLNDLHTQTGYSRAKISVYLKNLIQLDLVEKLVPVTEDGKENVQKGLYRIKDNFFSFWYRFIFPNLSGLMLGRIDEVYTEKIAPNLNGYIQEYFADVCTEYLKLMNQHRKLNEPYLWWDRWYGKNGTIDILAESNSGKTLTGAAIWADREADISDYEMLTGLAQDAGKKPDISYIFSRNGFSNELIQLAQSGELLLVGLDEL